MTIHHEIWLPIPGYEGVYSVSDMGRVRRDLKATSTQCGRILIGDTNKGYRRVKLTMHGVERRFFVHHLVAITYLGPQPLDKTPNHKNFVRHDNRIENLEWATRQEQARHAVEGGRWPDHGGRVAPRGDQHYSRTQPDRLARGARVRGSKLNAEIVLLIRSQWASGRFTMTQLSREHKVTRRAIRMVVFRESWTHI